jgi:hypothetical protein
VGGVRKIIYFKKGDGTKIPFSEFLKEQAKEHYNGSLAKLIEDIAKNTGIKKRSIQAYIYKQYENGASQTPPYDKFLKIVNFLGYDKQQFEIESDERVKYEEKLKLLAEKCASYRYISSYIVRNVCGEYFYQKYGRGKEKMFALAEAIRKLDPTKYGHIEYAPQVHAEKKPWLPKEENTVLETLEKLKSENLTKKEKILIIQEVLAKDGYYRTTNAIEEKINEFENQGNSTAKEQNLNAENFELKFRRWSEEEDNAIRRVISKLGYDDPNLIEEIKNELKNLNPNFERTSSAIALRIRRLGLVKEKHDRQGAESNIYKLNKEIKRMFKREVRVRNPLLKIGNVYQQFIGVLLQLAYPGAKIYPEFALTVVKENGEIVSTRNIVDFLIVPPREKLNGKNKPSAIIVEVKLGRQREKLAEQVEEQIKASRRFFNPKHYTVVGTRIGFIDLSRERGTLRGTLWVESDEIGLEIEPLAKTVGSLNTEILTVSDLVSKATEGIKKLYEDILNNYWVRKEVEKHPYLIYPLLVSPSGDLNATHFQLFVSKFAYYLNALMQSRELSRYDIEFLDDYLYLTNIFVRNYYGKKGVKRLKKTPIFDKDNPLPKLCKIFICIGDVKYVEEVKEILLSKSNEKEKNLIAGILAKIYERNIRSKDDFISFWSSLLSNPRELLESRDRFSVFYINDERFIQKTQRVFSRETKGIPLAVLYFLEAMGYDLNDPNINREKINELAGIALGLIKNDNFFKNFFVLKEIINRKGSNKKLQWDRWLDEFGLKEAIDKPFNLKTNILDKLFILFGLPNNSYKISVAKAQFEFERTIRQIFNSVKKSFRTHHPQRWYLTPKEYFELLYLKLRREYELISKKLGLPKLSEVEITYYKRYWSFILPNLPRIIFNTCYELVFIPLELAAKYIYVKVESSVARLVDSILTTTFNFIKKAHLASWKTSILKSWELLKRVSEEKDIGVLKEELIEIKQECIKNLNIGYSNCSIDIRPLLCCFKMAQKNDVKLIKTIQMNFIQRSNAFHFYLGECILDMLEKALALLCIDEVGGKEYLRRKIAELERGEDLGAEKLLIERYNILLKEVKPFDNKISEITCLQTKPDSKQNVRYEKDILLDVKSAFKFSKLNEQNKKQIKLSI